MDDSPVEILVELDIGQEIPKECWQYRFVDKHGRAIVMWEPDPTKQIEWEREHGRADK